MRISRPPRPEPSPVTDLRPLPLKIAAVIGVLLFGGYLALLLDDQLSVGAVFWAIVLAVGIVLAWFSDQLGRRSAQLAALIFFVLGLLSGPVYAVGFLAMVILCLVGFVRFDRGGEETS